MERRWYNKINITFNKTTPAKHTNNITPQKKKRTFICMFGDKEVLLLNPAQCDLREVPVQKAGISTS